MFKYKSKLSETKYPCLKTMEEILQWLVFAKSVDPYEIDPVFLGRLGAMAKYEGRKHVIISGYRPTSLQEKLYLNAGGVKNKDGTYSDPKGKVKGRVAKPNTSYHEFRIAVDSGDKYYKALNKNEATNKQINWVRFGLYKPLTIGNGIRAISCEDWHIQPLEVLEVSKEDRYKWQPELITESTQSPLEILKSKGIISDVPKWNNFVSGKTETLCINMKYLFISFYKYYSGKDDYIQALNFAMDNNIISDKAYWQDKCVRNEVVEHEYVKIVVERMADEINKIR